MQFVLYDVVWVPGTEHEWSGDSLFIRLIEKLGLTIDRGITMPGEEIDISSYSMSLD